MTAQPTRKRKEFERQLDVVGWVLFALVLSDYFMKLMRKPSGEAGPLIQPFWSILPLVIAIVLTYLVRYGLTKLAALRVPRVARWLGLFGLWIGAGLGLCWFSHALIVVLIGLLFPPVAIVPFLVGGAVGAAVAQLRSRTVFPVGGICLALMWLYRLGVTNAWTEWVLLLKILLYLVAGLGASLVVGRWVHKNYGAVETNG